MGMIFLCGVTILVYVTVKRSRRVCVVIRKWKKTKNKPGT
jgi:hypothetical protein